MALRLEFGWRLPDFPETWHDDPDERAVIFRDQILNFMDTIHGHLSTIWAGDHFFPWPAEMDQSTETLEPWTLLAFLLARYPKIKMITVLGQAYRPPALVAKMASVLQLLSGGRVILGIGAGWKENEHRAYGYDFLPDKVRLDMLEEAAQVIRKMWTDAAPTFIGKYYRIQDAYCSPRPHPPIPLLIGGFGPKRTLQIVAKYADWCNINDAGLDFCKSRLDTLREHCQTLGRDYESIVKSYIGDCVAIAPTHPEAERIRQASIFAPYQPMVGTPDEIAAQIRSYADLGFTQFIWRFADYPRTDGVELFIKEVLPRFEG